MVVSLTGYFLGVLLGMLGLRPAAPRHDQCCCPQCRLRQTSNGYPSAISTQLHKHHSDFNSWARSVHKYPDIDPPKAAQPTTKYVSIKSMFNIRHGCFAKKSLKEYNETPLYKSDALEVLKSFSCSEGISKG